MNASEVLERFGDLSVPIELEVGTLMRTIGEIFALREGMVLKTDHPSGVPFALYACGIKLAEAEVVVVDETVSVRIEKMLHSTEGPGANHGTN